MVDLLPLELIGKLERRAGDCLAQWGLPPRVPLLIKYRENAVFRVVRGTGNFAGLRLHRPGYHNENALRSEMEWLQALFREGLPVPEPIETSNGALLVALPTDEGEEVQYADLLTWLPGVPLGQTGTPLDWPNDQARDLFQQVGATAARLHLASDRWKPPRRFHRPEWNRQGLVGDSPVWGRFWDCPLLSQADRERLSALRAHLDRVLRVIETQGHDYGLIHADLVRENILVHEGRVSFIDFDDAGYGYRMFELATALLKNRSEPDFPALRENLVEGYRNIRPIAERELATLPLFMTLRALTYVGWIASRTEMPGAEVRLARYFRDTMELAAEPGGDGGFLLS